MGEMLHLGAVGTHTQGDSLVQQLSDLRSLLRMTNHYIDKGSNQSRLFGGRECSFSAGNMRTCSGITAPPTGTLFQSNCVLCCMSYDIT